jgi:hypothetical protein
MSAIATDRLYGVTTSVAVKSPCRVATTAAITLSGLQTVNGVALADGDRVLVKDQADTTTNGIYVASTGAWSRAVDFDGSRDVVNGTLVVVCQAEATGTVNIYQAVTTDPVVVGTSAITFMKVTNLTLAATESQTATAGQTLFTLTEISYGPGTNNLQVFANGLRLVSEVDYAETSATSVTLVSGAQAGDEMLFSAALPVNVSALASAIGYTPAGSGAVATNVQSALRAAYKSPEENGAAADGVTDDTAAFQRCIDYLEASGAELMRLDLRSKPYLINGTLTITKPIEIVGQGVYDLENARPTTRPPRGTWLIHGSTSGPLFQISSNTAKGASLSRFGVYQLGHPTPGVGWAPAVRDWVIRNENTQGTLRIKDVHFHNVYLGILCDYSNRPQFENITGQFFLNAITFDRIYDIGKLDGLHSWTYWSEDENVLQWTQANGKTVVLERVDGLWMDRIFSFAQSIAVYCGPSPVVSGGARVINIGGLYADFTGRALVVDNDVTHVTVNSLFQLGQAWPASPVAALSGACGVHFTSNSANSLVQIANYYTVLSAGSSVKMEGADDQLWIANPRIEQYDFANSGAGAFAVAATNLVYLGNPDTPLTYLGVQGPMVTGAGMVRGQLALQYTEGTDANKPVSVAADAGQLAVITVEGETDAGLAVVAKNAGTVNIGAATNVLAFYGGAGITKQTGVAVTDVAIHAALVALGLITA